MKILIYRSIPLSEETQEAWREAGCKFALRDRTPEDVFDLAERRGYDGVLNLGDSEFPETDYVWNTGNTVKTLLTSAAMRRSLLASVMPPAPREGEAFWVKGPGRGGTNKAKVDAYDPARHVYGNMLIDLQRHINGQEYRVVTAGTFVVQVSRRTDDRTDPTRRTYEWVGETGAPGRVNGIARYATSMLSTPRTVIGWDIVDSGDRVYILEGNSCPGVNAATAKRIIDKMSEVYTGFDWRERFNLLQERGVRNTFFEVRANNPAATLTDIAERIRGEFEGTLLRPPEMWTTTDTVNTATDEQPWLHLTNNQT